MFTARKLEPTEPLPDWRDPDMPCVVRVNNPFTNSTEEWLIDQSFRQLTAQQQMDSGQLHWSRDPTYNMRRKR